MFERRLKVLLVILALPTALLVLRLVELQIIHAAAYQRDARQMLIRPARFFPCLRGSITDRHGRPLAYDAPTWDLAVHYGVLTGDEKHLTRAIEQL